MNSSLLPEAVEPDPYPFVDFAPSLAQCYFIVIAGYLAARFQLLSASEVRGVNAYAAYFAMPGIICISLANATWGDFRWELLLGLLLGKAVVFALVAGFAFTVSGNVGVAGLLAVFCAHSNDLPVGNPLVSSLYRNHRPQMLKYLFLMPASTVAVFLPIGSYMIRAHRRKRNPDDRNPARPRPGKNRLLKELLSVAGGLILHPVILATLAGLVLSAIFNGKMPEVMQRPINVVAATIPGIALSLLGFSMVRKERYLISSAVLLGLLLVAAKMIVTPLATHTIVRLLAPESSKLLTDFSLLYGILSPATVVFQSGHQYRKPLAAMSAALIVSSLSCFPVSYVVARFTIAPSHKLSSYIPFLSNILVGVACLSATGDIIVCISILWKKQWCKVPCCYVFYLVLTQLATCFGVIVGPFSDGRRWVLYLQMALYHWGEISGYLWTGTLAIVLCLAEWYPELAAHGHPILSFTAFLLSAIITSVMCLLASYNDVQKVFLVGRARTNFEFLQLIAASILLLLCLMVVAACLIRHFRKCCAGDAAENLSGHCVDVQVLFSCDKEATCSKRRPSLKSAKDAFCKNEEEELYYKEHHRKGTYPKKGGSEILHHEYTFKLFSLLLLLWITMAVKLMSNVLKLVRSQSLEIMVPLEFVQSISFVGQGILIFLTFGVDIRTFTIGMVKRWRRLRYGGDVCAPVESTSTPKNDASLFCEQFCTFYFHSCFRDLARERTWKKSIYHDCFWGHQLVDWLIERGVCADDVEAEEYGQKLMNGGVVRHVRDAQAHSFHDAPYLYHFVRRRQQCSP